MAMASVLFVVLGGTEKHQVEGACIGDTGPIPTCRLDLGGILVPQIILACALHARVTILRAHHRTLWPSGTSPPQAPVGPAVCRRYTCP